MVDTLTMHWQYFENGTDITGSVDAKQDATQAQLWDEGGVLLAGFERLPNGRWRVSGSDVFDWVSLADFWAMSDGDMYSLDEWYQPGTWSTERESTERTRDFEYRGKVWTIRLCNPGCGWGWYLVDAPDTDGMLSVGPTEFQAVCGARSWIASKSA